MKDLTFIIPVRIDSEERILNLLLIVDKLLACSGESSFIIMEGDSCQRVTGLPNNKRIKYLFETDENMVFYRTRFLNKMAALVQTSNIAVWDTDVLVAESQIVEALDLLRSGEADFVFPYDGRIYQVLPFLRNIYKQCGDWSILNGYTKILPLMYGTNSYGGCFMANLDKYKIAGMENERFYGWGPEDLERVKRWEILGYSIRRVEGGAYHFQHPILENSYYADKKIAAANNRELLRICSMSSEELRNDIATWSDWVAHGSNNID